VTSLAAPPGRVRAAVAGRLPPTAAPLATAVVALAGCAAVTVADPNEPGHYPTCPFLALTGLQCPGCGTLRAVRALLHGDLLAAASLNLLTVALLPVLAWGWVGWLQHRRGRRARPPAIPTAAAWALVVVVPAFWLLRNLPVAPWAWLAP
jgi:hypothetical protein